VGCNFKCRFCQNADIAQMPSDHKGVIEVSPIPIPNRPFFLNWPTIPPNSPMKKGSATCLSPTGI
jgi:hypothetical protein